MITLFVRAADMLGLPKSVGEIYGLLYATEEALPLDAIVTRLSISKGSASQGLRFLRHLNAVRLVYVTGDRRDHFVPETSLRALAAGFIKERISPHLESGQARLQHLEQLIEQEGDNAHLRDGLRRLRLWHQRAKRLLPFLRRFVSS